MRSLGSWLVVLFVNLKHILALSLILCLVGCNEGESYGAGWQPEQPGLGAGGEQQKPDQGLPEQPEPAPEQPESEPPLSLACEDAADAMLILVNQARAQARSCGKYGDFPAVPPLESNLKLVLAAEYYSIDMANTGCFAHDCGSTLPERLTAQSYNYRTAGENIAWGQQNAEVAVNAWLGSPGHCRNIMNGNFTEMGAGCVAGNGKYWTQVFGSPR